MRNEVPKTYINVIENIYEGSCTSVQRMCGETENFRVRVEVLQGSALSSIPVFYING